MLVENEFKKLQTFNSSLFIGQSYFYNDGAQLFKNISPFSGVPDTIWEWESKGLSNEGIKPPYTATKSLWYGWIIIK